MPDALIAVLMLSTWALGLYTGHRVTVLWQRWQDARESDQSPEGGDA